MSDSNHGGHGGARTGAGRKPRAVEEELQSILKAGWPRADRVAAVKKIAERANKGDLKAAQFLFERGYGKPRETRELSGPGGKPIEVDNTHAIKNVPSLDELRNMDADELYRIHRATLGLSEEVS